MDNDENADVPSKCSDTVTVNSDGKATMNVPGTFGVAIHINVKKLQTFCIYGNRLWTLVNSCTIFYMNKVLVKIFVVLDSLIY